MGSIIKGYNYDIFISYRQKDNKYDGWVTEFVDNLKKELEATFKEEISVYFDINPHDGLLETHDVDESLKNKLKCLIFIPVISRTYCDPRSFAWEHEFKAFTEQASLDPFGLKVKLPNGNVASRVLPVRIHDLDAEDIRECELALGGFLRGVEFIYKEPGVDKPLAPGDDEKKNLNHTSYRIQIVKVAHAIREIITGLQHPQITGSEGDRSRKEAKPAKKKPQLAKWIAVAAVLMALTVAWIFVFPKLFSPGKELEKSLAVLPFMLLSDEPDKQYLADGMMDAITLHLSKIKELRVLGRTSTEQYRNLVKTTSDIGRELDVNYLLEGSFQKFGENVRLIVQLIRVGKEGHVWANEYDRNWSDIFKVQSEVAQKVAGELQAAITPEEKQLIDITPTDNLTAYDFYQKGWDQYVTFWVNNSNINSLKNAESLIRKALQIDPEYSQAYIGLARICWDKYYGSEDFLQNYLDSVKILANEALSYDKNASEALSILGDCYRAMGNNQKALEEYDRALSVNPNLWQVYYGKAFLYYNDDLVNYIDNLHKAALHNKGRERIMILRRMLLGYSFAGILDVASKLNLEILRLDGDSAAYFNAIGTIDACLNNIDQSIENFKRAYKIDSTYTELLFSIGEGYQGLGLYDESLRYFRKWISKLEHSMIISFKYNGMHRVGYTYWEKGYFKEADYYFNLQIKYCKNIEDQFLPFQNKFAHYDRAGIYAFKGEKEKAYEYLRKFNGSMTRMPFWMVMIIKNDPLFKSINNEPEFQQIVRDVEAKYQAEHERVRKWLEENKIF